MTKKKNPEFTFSRLHLHESVEIIEITISPISFLKKPLNFFASVNKKWFFNISNCNIPEEVAKLLLFRDRFCLPFSNNKKILRY